MANPLYPPEITTQVTLLNFVITFDALRNQLLSILFKMEDPKDEDERVKLIIQTAEFKQKSIEKENEIL